MTTEDTRRALVTRPGALLGASPIACRPRRRFRRRHPQVSARASLRAKAVVVAEGPPTDDQFAFARRTNPGTHAHCVRSGFLQVEIQALAGVLMTERFACAKSENTRADRTDRPTQVLADVGAAVAASPSGGSAGARSRLRNAAPTTPI